MKKPLATYNADSGELRSNPKGFAENDDYVASIVWQKQVDDDVSPGDTIATIQWGNGPPSPLTAPEGCTGKVRDLSNNILYEKLEYEPSKYLARIA
jgi:hypothetical protein